MAKEKEMVSKEKTSNADKRGGLKRKDALVVTWLPGML